MQLTLQRAVAAPLLGFALLAHPNTSKGDVHVATDVMAYTDTDNVQVISPRTSVAYDFDDEGSEVRAAVTIDVVSAASVDVVSHATTRFSETRTAVDLKAAHVVGHHLPSFAYRFSTESDYVSHGGQVGWQSELGTPDTTLRLGYGLTYDTIGRAGTPLALFSESLVTHSAELGVTQALSTVWIVRIVYSLTVQSGTLEKPYRHVPLFDRPGMAAAEQAGVRLDLGSFDRYRLSARPPEQVPDRRLRHAIAFRSLRYVRSIAASLRLDYQLYFDDWAMLAHTLEPAAAFELGDTMRLTAFMRLYAQTAVSFWRRAYVVESAASVPRYRSVDRDLSEYVTVSAGTRFEVDAEPFSFYVEARATYTMFERYMFLDDVFALVGQVGARWNP